MDLLFAAIAAVKNKEEDGESTQRKVRLYDPKKTHAVYQRVKARRVASLREQVKRIWELFPADGIKRLCSSSMEDSNHNYGLHQSNLGFDTVPRSNSEGRINGTRTMGLRYENEHTVHLHKRDMCPYSEKHLQFLLTIQQSLKTQYPTLNSEILEYMRVNLVVGAKTKEHTDCQRGATRNFMLLEPGKHFNLRVRPFPKFRSSVVKYDSKFWIPHKLDSRNLTMIGLSGNGPHFYLFPTTVIDLLEPYGDLVDYVSVGIKDGKIQVIPWNYQVFESPRDMPLLPWESIMAHVSQNPVSAKKPRIRYLAKTDRWETFYGWQVAHKWLEGTDSDNRRIHVFFRPVREETPSARIRTNSEGVPMNYTFYEVE